MLTEWLTRLRFLLSRKTHRDVDDELRFHLDQQTAANIAAGIPAPEAQRQAVLAFGAIQRTREACREQRPGFYLETILQDIRYAIRGFRRNPIFTLTILATLTLGIGATTAVFSIVDRILFRPLPYAHADRLVSVGLALSLGKEEFALGYFYYDWSNNQKAFTAMTSESADTSACDLTEHNPVQLSCPRVQQNFLPTFGISPVLGRNFLPEEDRSHGPKAALISYGLWLTRYNRDPNILNKTIALDGNTVRIVGVLPKDFEMPRLQPADILLPIALDEADDIRGNSGLGIPRRAYGRLKPGVTIDQARAQLEPLSIDAIKRIPADIRKNYYLQLRSLRDRQMQDVRLEAWVLLATVFVVLLIACANVASLLMARAATRQQEFAVRSALGASRTRLVRQGLVESLLLSLSGAIAGCILANILLRLFLSIAPASIPYLDRIHLDLRIISFAVLLSILCGVLSGIAPALQKPNRESLSGRSRAQISHASARQWLVVAQIAASMVLLTGAALLLRSFRNIEDQKLGMRTDNTIVATLTLGEHNYPTSSSKLNFFLELTQRLRFTPGISLVSGSDSLPPNAGNFGIWLNQINLDGRSLSSSDRIIVRGRLVSPDYFHILDIPILRGQGFHEEDLTTSEHPVVLSKRLADLIFSNEDPIGQRMRFWDRSTSSSEAWSTVVGVAANVKNSGLTKEEEPEFYRLRRNLSEDWNHSGVADKTLIVAVRSSLPPDQTSRLIRTQIAALDPTLPVDISTLRQQVRELADQPRFQTILVGFFAATGLILAIIGLYGVISFLVTQRTQEIGIRMALGASRANIRNLILGRSLRLIAIGTATGLLAAISVSRLLSSLLYSISPHDPLTFVSITLLLIVIALAATLLPARTATKVDPNVALRCD